MKSPIQIGIFLLYTLGLTAQCPNSLSVTSQEAIERFVEDFPNCTEIQNNLTISRKVVDLSLLSNITRVGLKLEFSDLDNDLDASGLQNLTYVGGDIVIDNCENITNLCNSLLEVEEEIFIQDMDNYAIEGFDSLEKIGQNINVQRISNLTLPTFNALEECGGSINVEGDTKVEGKFNALEYIHGSLNLSSADSNLNFPALEFVDGRIVIVQMDNLVSIQGFNSLKEVGDDFLISSNPELVTIEGFESLITLRGGFSISGNSKIKKISGFETVGHISDEGVFNISRNDSLEEIDMFNLSNLLNESTIISNNPNLQSIKGFGGFGNYRTNLTIQSNERLTSVEGFNNTRDFIGNISISTGVNATIGHKIFEKLEKLEGAISILGNKFEPTTFNNLISPIGNIKLVGIENIPPFESLTQLEGDLSIVFCGFPSYNVFDNLQTIEGELDLDCEETLEEIRGFNSLENAEDIIFSESGIKKIIGFNGLKTWPAIVFREHVDLEEVNGFNALESLEALFFYDNPDLQIISGFEELKLAENTFAIKGNPQLISIPRFNNLEGEIEIFELFGNNLDSLLGFNALEVLNSDSRFTISGYKYVDGLNSLRIIEDDFFLASDELETINGFNSLEEIDGRLVFGALPNLQSPLPSFESLLITKGGISVSDDYTFDVIPVFPNLVDAGALTVKGLSSLKGFDKVEILTGGLSIKSNSLESIEGLQNLREVGAITIEDNPNLTKLDFFNQLENIAASFEISNNDKLENIGEFNNLVNIGGRFTIFSNPVLKEIVGFNSLFTATDIRVQFNNSFESIIGFKSLEECQKIILRAETINGFNQLNKVPDQLLLGDTTTKIIVGFESLDSVGALVITIPFLEAFSEFESLTYAESLRVGSIGTVESISAFENLKTIGIMQFANNVNFKELPDFPSLTKLNELLINNNPALRSIDKFNKIDSLSELTISGNQNIEEITGFGSLEHIEKIQIRENANLFSLSALNNIESFPVENQSTVELVITDNPKLSFCSLPLLCDYLLDEENENFIQNNAPGCNSDEEILENCGVVNSVNIHTFLDANGNRILDNNERNIAGIPIQLSPPDRMFISNNDTHLIRSFMQFINIELADDIEDWNLTSLQDSYTISLTDNNILEDVYFGFTPKNIFTSIDGNINAETFRCNTDVNMNLDIKNLGTTITPTIAYLTLDSRLENFSFDNEPDIVLDEFRVGWDLSNFHPTETITQTINISVPMVESLGMNRMLEFELAIHYTDDEGVEQVLIKNYEGVVRCSFDPNDKRVFPQTEFGYLPKGEPITYNIRFQNTGNDVAFDVIVLDTISPFLDISSFELMGTSHPRDLQVFINDDRQVAFEFIGINLLDSLNNEPDSHGYITYRINTIDSVEDFDEITNSASIYFDANLPVHTNETLNIIGEDRDDDGYLIVDDCDDNNAAINPGNTEEPYNGMDDDCNPETLDDDLDQDGFALAEDCDDDNADVNPNATEIPNNGVDEDCDGSDLTTATHELSDVEIKIYPNPASDVIIVDISSPNILDHGYVISLYDLQGHLVKVSANETIIDVSKLPSSIYLLKVEDGETGAFILERIRVGI